MRDEHDILTAIRHSSFHMTALHAVRTLALPDWWIAAGFVRNLVWDRLHGHADITPLNDIDVIYYDAAQIDELFEKSCDRQLKALLPQENWSVKNQARMHVRNGDTAYSSVAEALCHWCETPTTVGVRLEADDSLTLIAPLGLDDLLNGICRATPMTLGKPKKLNDYRQRVAEKNWQELWPQLQIHDLRTEEA